MNTFLLRTFFICLCMSALPLATDAKSVTVTNLYTPLLSGPTVTTRAGLVGWHLKNTRALTTYTTSVYDEVSGVRISENGNVSVGQKIILEFADPQYSDISWFATPGSVVRNNFVSIVGDSPYGEWQAGASEPALINSDDYFGRVLTQYTGRSTNSSNGEAGGGIGLVGVAFTLVYENVYAALTVEYPTKSIFVPSGLSCGPLSGNSTTVRRMNCTVTGSGALTPVFTIENTFGKFYTYRSGRTTVRNTIVTDKPYFTLTSAGAPYTATISGASIPYTLNSQPNNAPSAPTIAEVSKTSDACVFTDVALTVTATDPENNNIRFGIDSNNDATIDQWVPSNGTYVPAGTSLDFVQSWQTAGEKTIRVITQDEFGLTSAESTFTLTVSDTGACTPSDLPETLLTADDYDVNLGHTTTYTWSSGVHGAACTPPYKLGDPTPAFTRGSSGTYDVLLPDGSHTYTITCKNTRGAVAIDTANPVAVHAPTILSFRPLKSVRSGAAATLSWSARFVTSCRVRDDVDVTLYSGSNIVGTISTRVFAVLGEYIHTLTCTNEYGRTVSADATVQVTEPPLAPVTGILQANPTRAKKNGVTTIVWSTTPNGENCIVTGDDSGDWSGPSGEQTTSPILQEKIYTLSCDNLPESLQASVKLLPNFSEL